MTATHEPAVAALARRVRELFLDDAAALVPGLLVVALIVLWAVQNGGYDTTTWYWGALALLALLAVVLVVRGPGRLLSSRARVIALVAFATYVAWSYASIAWAQSPGDALDGSNRALLYLLLFALMAALPWSDRAALGALLAFALALGVIAVVILLRLASADHVPALVVDGRLEAPTGYFNSTVALFMMGGLVSTSLAARRELPGLLRGTLIGSASACLQLAVVGQSRGWLFTLPLVVVVTAVVVPDRMRFAAASVLPVAAAVIPVHELLAVHDHDFPLSALNHAAHVAGRIGLLLSAAALVLGTLLAWTELVIRPRPLSASGRRRLGGALIAVAILVGAAGATAATHGHPIAFVKREWAGFSHPPEPGPTSSHFATVGSGRYDVWRVSLDALLAHPIGGLGQDNFADYYSVHRRTNETPMWTHSLEMRLLAHTGLVGFALFTVFVIAALVAATRARRGTGAAAGIAGAALLPLIVWLIHGSIDWFWEMPALSGPALGFLGMSIALGPADAPRTTPASSLRRRLSSVPRPVGLALGAAALPCLVAVLGFPYLSAREVARASQIGTRNPIAALSDLSDAANLDPLSAAPGRLAGTIALQIGDYLTAEQRFRQSIKQEPGGWFAWFGDGLAASALGDETRAEHDYQVAESIDSSQPAVRIALQRADSLHPVTPPEGLNLLILVH